MGSRHLTFALRTEFDHTFALSMRQHDRRVVVNDVRDVERAMQPAGEESEHVGNVARSLDVRIGAVNRRCGLAGPHRDRERVVSFLHDSVAVARVVTLAASQVGVSRPGSQ